MIKPGDKIQGVGPDGKPATFTIAKGRMYCRRCAKCGMWNGGGIESPKFPTMLNDDCIYCPDGKMEKVYMD